MKMQLCDCSPEYWEFVRELRTNPENSEGFFTQVQISPEDQIKHMKSNSFRYNICLLDNSPVGYIGIIPNNEITYCVHPDHKSKGIGTWMVKEFSSVMENLEAFVKVENIASQKVFEKLGWEKQIYYKLKTN